MFTKFWRRHVARAVPQGDDEILIDRLRRSDPDAADALIDRYGAWIHRVARRILADEQDAEEVTQDVLLTIAQKIGTFKGEAKFSSWIYRIAANAAYRRLRTRRARQEVPIESLLPVFDDEGRHAAHVADWSRQLEDPAQAREARDAIEQAIRALPDEYRTVLVLRDVEELTNEDVAAALGLTVAAVKSRLHRARLALRQRLSVLFTPAR